MPLWLSHDFGGIKRKGYTLNNDMIYVQNLY